MDVTVRYVGSLVDSLATFAGIVCSGRETGARNDVTVELIWASCLLRVFMTVSENVPILVFLFTYCDAMGNRN